MAKVWILERFYSREWLLDKCAEYYKLGRDNADNRELFETITKVYDTFAKDLEENPDGMWCGFEGKTNYKQFCYCAKGAIRRNKGVKFRVVRAEIADDAKFWLGYKNPVVNENVLRYLYATL